MLLNHIEFAFIVHINTHVKMGLFVVEVRTRADSVPLPNDSGRYSTTRYANRAANNSPMCQYVQVYKLAGLAYSPRNIV